jgi:hypothetical protein
MDFLCFVGGSKDGVNPLAFSFTEQSFLVGRQSAKQINGSL